MVVFGISVFSDIGADWCGVGHWQEGVLYATIKIVFIAKGFGDAKA
ncbi:MAG TPA: hypothetical protein VLL52_01620 [Anaerolineae bacterium]|nr:hypothetical protein [Anaerolineae bacterium]